MLAPAYPGFEVEVEALNGTIPDRGLDYFWGRRAPRGYRDELRTPRSSWATRRAACLQILSTTVTARLG